jgi:OOP family OmpA-OmpF porin
VRVRRLAILCLLAGVILVTLYYATRPVERITLLPQPDGSPSAIVVQSKTGATSVLDRPYSVATVTDKRIGSAQTDEAAVKTRYNELFDAFPARPRSYMLFFSSGGTTLTPESEKFLPTLMKVLIGLKDLPASELTVIGHADEVGANALNDELSRQRAMSVVAILRAQGIDTTRASIVGRGSRDPLVPRQKGVSEERNRRVEIRLK